MTTHPTYPGTDRPIHIGDTVRLTVDGEFGQITTIYDDTSVHIQLHKGGHTTASNRLIGYVEPTVTLTIELTASDFAELAAGTVWFDPGTPDGRTIAAVIAAAQAHMKNRAQVEGQ